MDGPKMVRLRATEWVPVNKTTKSNMVVILTRAGHRQKIRWQMLICWTNPSESCQAQSNKAHPYFVISQGLVTALKRRKNPKSQGQKGK